MKKIFLFVLLLFSMVLSAITRIQDHDTTTNLNGATLVLTYPSSVTDNSLLLCIVEGYTTNRTHSVADDNGNSWEIVDSNWYSAATDDICLFMAVKANAGATVVTATYSDNQNYRRMAIVEYSGVDTLDPLVYHSLFYNTTPAIGTDVIVSEKGLPSEVGCLLFSTWQECNFLTNSEATAGTGFTLIFKTAANYHLMAEDSICDGTDSVASTWSIAAQGEVGNYNGIYAIFKPLGSGEPDSSITIDVQPVDQNLSVDETTDLFAVITCEVPVAYQWYRKPFGESWGAVTDSIDSTFEQVVTVDMDGDSFYLEISNDYETVYTDSVILNVSSSAISLTEYDTNRIFQRMGDDGQPGGTTCTLTITGTYSGADTIWGMVRRTDESDTPVTWTKIDSGLSGGTFSGSLVAPTGCWYKMSVYSDAGDTSHGTKRFGVGDVWLVAGQSLIMGWNAAHDVARDTANDSVVNFTRLYWERLIDPMVPGHGASPFVKLGNRLTNETGYPHAFLNTAVGGTRLYGNWNTRSEPISDTSTSIYNKSAYKGILAGGKVIGLIWGQGESDAVSGTSKTNYMNTFDTLLKWYRYDLGIDSMPVFYDVIGKFGNGVGATVDEVSVITDAQLSLENHNKKYYLCASLWSLPLVSDSTHLTIAGNDTLGVWFGEKLTRWYDNAIDSFPRITGLSYNYDGNSVVTITTSASELSSISELPQLVIFDWNGDTLECSGISLSGNTIYDTLVEIPSTDSIYLTYGNEYWPNSDSVLTDIGGFVLPRVFDSIPTDAYYLMITGDPSDQSVPIGTSANFTVTVTGNPTPDIQWQIKEDGGSWSDTSGQTGLTFAWSPNDTDRDFDTVRAIASNYSGNDTSGLAVLHVYPMYSIDTTSQWVTGVSYWSLTEISGLDSNEVIVTTLVLESGYHFNAYTDDFTGTDAIDSFNISASMTIGLDIDSFPRVDSIRPYRQYVNQIDDTTFYLDIYGLNYGSSAGYAIIYSVTGGPDTVSSFGLWSDTHLTFEIPGEVDRGPKAIRVFKNENTYSTVSSSNDSCRLYKPRVY